MNINFELNADTSYLDTLSDTRLITLAFEMKGESFAPLRIERNCKIPQFYINSLCRKKYLTPESDEITYLQDGDYHYLAQVIRYPGSITVYLVEIHLHISRLENLSKEKQKKIMIGKEAEEVKDIPEPMFPFMPKGDEDGEDDGHDNIWWQSLQS